MVTNCQISALPSSLELKYKNSQVCTGVQVHAKLSFDFGFVVESSDVIVCNIGFSLQFDLLSGGMGLIKGEYPFFFVHGRCFMVELCFSFFLSSFFLFKLIMWPSWHLIRTQANQMTSTRSEKARGPHARCVNFVGVNKSRLTSNTSNLPFYGEGF